MCSVDLQQAETAYKTTSCVNYRKYWPQSILLHNGPFRKNIHELRSVRSPRSKARPRSERSQCRQRKSLRVVLLLFLAHASLAFDLVTRRDPVHKEWSRLCPSASLWNWNVTERIRSRLKNEKAHNSISGQASKSNKITDVVLYKFPP